MFFLPGIEAVLFFGIIRSGLQGVILYLCLASAPFLAGKGTRKKKLTLETIFFFFCQRLEMVHHEPRC